MVKIDLKKFDKLTANQWEDKIVYRGVHKKYKKLLLPLLPMYVDKINNQLTPRLNDLQFFLDNPLTFGNLSRFLKVFSIDMFEEFSHSELKEMAEKDADFLNQKILRLTEKYAIVTKEIALRDAKQVKRNPHGTTYYIDLAAGNDGNDGLAIGTPWLTLNKYTTVELRTAGDIAKVRAATSQVFAADLNFDENGNADAILTIKGCSVADDPWSDGSDVRPILDFNGTSAEVYLAGDNYWKFQNLDFKGTATTYACVSVSGSSNEFFDNCRFYDNGIAGLKCSVGCRVEVKNCEFYSNVLRSIDVTTSFSNMVIKGCTFNGGAGTTDYGIYFASEAGPLILIDCVFGQTTPHDTSDICMNYSSHLIMRNCNYNSISWGSDVDKAYRLHKEDDGQVFEVQKVDNYDVAIERETGVVRVGGADSSLKMTPSSRVGLYAMVNSNGEQGEIVRGTFKVWLAASVEKTISIYIRGFGWTGFPTAPQLFVRASYLSNGATAARTEIDSDEVIADNANWVAFNVTLTPARDGFVYLDVFVAHYEAASGVYVDIKPVIA